MDVTLVRDFMAKAKALGPLDDKSILRCAKLVHEESSETIEALGYVVKPEGALERIFGMPSVRETTKECIDVIYVAVYTLYTLGLSESMIEAAWDLVCANNLAKFGEGHSFRDGDGKLIPPPGFVKENLKSLFG